MAFEDVVVDLPAEPTLLSPELAQLLTKLSREPSRCGASLGTCATSSSAVPARSQIRQRQAPPCAATNHGCRPAVAGPEPGLGTASLTPARGLHLAHAVGSRLARPSRLDIGSDSCCVRSSANDPVATNCHPRQRAP